MKQWFKKIWKDPVGSKIISVVIIGLSSIAFNYVEALVKKESFKKTFLNFWGQTFQLWQIILIVALVFLLILIILKNKTKTKIPLKNSFDGINIETFVNNINEESEIENYDDELKKVDTELFNKIRNKYLPAENEISWLKEQDFAHGFNRDFAFIFFDFEEKMSKNPNLEFLGVELENIRKELVSNIKIFNKHLISKTFPSDGKMQSVPKEWQKTNPKIFIESVKLLNDSKEKVIECYDRLIRIGREKLKV